MYDELVKALRFIAKQQCRVEGEQTKICAQASDAIEELSKQMKLEYQSGFADGQIAANRKKPRWIPVTERLPEDRHDVLVYAGIMFPYITVGYYDGLWKFSYNDEEIAGSADYWMPLPEPPKEET